jgi:uncharacterized membrane protein YphA (DoxX/SURF4 family)
MIGASLIQDALAASEEARLQKPFSSFPDGLPGIGLILLRIAVAIGLILGAVDELTASNNPSITLWVIGLAKGGAGASLLIGFLTPIAGSFAAIVNATVVFLILRSGEPSDARVFTAISQVVMSLALALLGPGAFSLDARLFGRREIVIPDHRRPR